MENSQKRSGDDNSIKKKLLSVRLYSFAIIGGLALVLSLIWGGNQYKEKREYQRYLSNQYNRNFYVLNEYINNIDSALTKVPMASTSKQKSIMYSEIWRMAYTAQDLLGQLPIDNPTLSKASKYLKQVGDYNQMLLRKDAMGQSITKENIAQLNKFEKYSARLRDDMTALQNTLDNGRIHFDELAREGKQKFRQDKDKIAASKIFTSIDKTFVKYPTLIYDGPFSDHMTAKQALSQLKGAKITRAEAEKLAMQYISGKITNVVSLNPRAGINRRVAVKPNFYVTGNPKNVKVAEPSVYNMEVTRKYGNRKEKMYVSISKRGKYLVNILSSRGDGNEKLSLIDAERFSRAFLKKTGFNGMTPVYYQKYSGAVVINYVYKDQNGVVVYPDMIKVKVSLDNGDIIGFDATSYLSSHRKRQRITPALTQQQAKAKVTTAAFDIKGVDLAIIPLETKSEALCYEFKGFYNKKYFLVYVNAVTGQEENILQVIDTERGKLAM